MNLSCYLCTRQLVFGFQSIFSAVKIIPDGYKGHKGHKGHEGKGNLGRKILNIIVSKLRGFCDFRDLCVK